MTCTSLLPRLVVSLTKSHAFVQEQRQSTTHLKAKRAIKPSNTFHRCTLQQSSIGSRQNSTHGPSWVSNQVTRISAGAVAEHNAHEGAASHPAGKHHVDSNKAELHLSSTARMRTINPQSIIAPKQQCNSIASGPTQHSTHQDTATHKAQ
jgi:hypothetical protein